ncbi:hypothetical protein B4144_3334 [Bacillus atrophaeus]|nr:hypothetical protein B4144_3334 [Bacillus atrophaeus]
MSHFLVPFISWFTSAYASNKAYDIGKPPRNEKEKEKEGNSTRRQLWAGYMTGNGVAVGLCKSGRPKKAYTGFVMGDWAWSIN